MQEFQEAHKTYASQGQSNLAESESDVKHHFIAFVLNKKGQLVELDGMKAGPVVIKDHSDNLLKDTAAILSKRVEDGHYSESLAVLTLNKKPDEWLNIFVKKFTTLNYFYVRIILIKFHGIF